MKVPAEDPLRLPPQRLPRSDADRRHSGEFHRDLHRRVSTAAMLVAVLLFAPTLAWPMLAAIPASVARIGLTLRTLPSTLTHR